MWINHKLVDFNNAAKMHKVTPGCALSEEEADQAKDVIRAEETFRSPNHEHSGDNQH